MTPPHTHPPTRFICNIYCMCAPELVCAKNGEVVENFRSFFSGASVIEALPTLSPLPFETCSRRTLLGMMLEAPKEVMTRVLLVKVRFVTTVEPPANQAGSRSGPALLLPLIRLIGN